MTSEELARRLQQAEMAAAQSETSTSQGSGPSRQSQPQHPIGPRDKKVHEMPFRILFVNGSIFSALFYESSYQGLWNNLTHEPRYHHTFGILKQLFVLKCNNIILPLPGCHLMETHCPVKYAFTCFNDSEDNHFYVIFSMFQIE